LEANQRSKKKKTFSAEGKFGHWAFLFQNLFDSLSSRQISVAFDFLEHYSDRFRLNAGNLNAKAV